jgi:hypothetical protein
VKRKELKSIHPELFCRNPKQIKIDYNHYRIDNKSVKKVVQYYVEIKYIEEQYKKLELIHGVPLSYLLVIQLKDETDRLNHNNNFPGWDEIEEFLSNSRWAYKRMRTKGRFSILS